MHVLVDLTLFANVRQHGISCDYRPDWRPMDDPQAECHSAAVWLPAGRNLLDLGDSCQALLRPLAPDLWDFLTPGMLLHAYEGSRITALAKVRRIFATP